jgi:transcriptional regulator of met regulon
MYDSHVANLVLGRIPTCTQNPLLSQSGSLVHHQTSLRESTNSELVCDAFALVAIGAYYR